MRKTVKNVCRRSTKCRICQKALVIRGWKRKRGKKRLSSTDESEKTAKSIHHPRMKVKIYPKALVIRGWNAENAKNCPSSVDESEKTAKSRINENNPRLRSNALESRNRMDRKDIGQELPTNVHTLIFQHTQMFFCVLSSIARGSISQTTHGICFFCVLIRLC